MHQVETTYLINRSQNHSLSDDIDKMLTLQGVGWVTRKIIRSATITLFIKHYKDDEGAEHIDIQQTVTGGISGASEYRILNWTWNKADHSLFGAVVARNRRIPVEEVTDEYLKSGWLPDVSRDEAIQSYAETDEEKNSNRWKSDMVNKFSPYKSCSPHVLT